MSAFADYFRVLEGQTWSESRPCLGSELTLVGAPTLPSDPDEAVDFLRLERYAPNPVACAGCAVKSLVRSAYYLVRPLMPVGVRRHLQRAALRGWDSIPFPRWPVDTTVDDLMVAIMRSTVEANGGSPVPFVWFWPDGADSAVIVTHDIETASGRDFCGALMDVDDSRGVKSSFQVVPEKRYEVTEGFLASIRDRGFEVNIHGLNHDGSLFMNRKVFLDRAARINECAARFGARGFRSPVLYRNLNWLADLQFSYDMSVPNVGHLDPQRGGCCTVMPYFIRGILELPLTLTQDYSLFHVLSDFSIGLWKDQITRICKCHGLVSVNTHPDYLLDERSRSIYELLLDHLRQTAAERGMWITLPGEVDRWWRQRSEMRIVHAGGEWVVEGDGSERARVAWAEMDGVGLSLRIAAARNAQPGLVELT